jgi:DNA-directed RNA polymerase specialized sigma24 family protein
MSEATPELSPEVAEVELSICRRVVEEVARGYRRRCWWADMDDMRQEAMLELSKSLPKRDREQPLAPWVRTIAMRAMRNLLWRASTPCSAPQHPEMKHVAVLRTQQREAPPAEGAPVPVDGPDVQLTAEGPEHPSPEALVMGRRYTLRLREELQRVILADDRTGHLALEVLLYDAPAGEVAEREEVEVVKVHRAIAAAKRRITHDATLRAMWLAGYTDNETGEE